MHSPHVLSGGRYPVLRALAIIYVFGAALACIGTVLTLGYILFAARFAWSDKLIMLVGAIAAGFVAVVSMLAIAEVLKLFIDVEHNTRMSAAAGQLGMPASITGASAMTTVPADASGVAVVSSNFDGGRFGGRLQTLDEETAEAALIRGH